MTDTITHDLRTDFLSESLDNLDFVKYSAFKARNPDKNSEFRSKTEYFSTLSDEGLIQALFSQNYNVLIYHNDIILGHVGYQSHAIPRSPSSFGDMMDAYNWGVFSVFIEEEHRNKGHGTNLVKELITQARSKKARVLKIGRPKPEDKMTDGEKALKTILHKIRQEEKDLDVIVYPEQNIIYL